MLITFIFSYLESFFVVFHLSFYFILALAISAREPLLCFFNDINFQAFEVPFHSGTRCTHVPQFEPKTSWSSCKNIIDWASRPGRTRTMWSLRGRQLIWFSCRRPIR